MNIKVKECLRDCGRRYSCPCEDAKTLKGTLINIQDNYGYVIIENKIIQRELKYLFIDED